MSVIGNATMTVRSAQGDYAVDFVRSVEDAAAAIDDPQTFVLIDERVAALYPQIVTFFDSSRVCRLTASEERKTLAGVEQVVLFLQGSGASRSSRLAIVGGGIVQDVGTFAAHIYFRGIPYVYVPTTLLSMSDSCIGAKCGLNLGSFKNQIGFFQSPSRVVVAPAFLSTLPRDDIRSGFGEIVKLAIISGALEFDGVERYLEERGFDGSHINATIRASLETKRHIIEQDEYERNLRKTLNYGHTFAHAFETLTAHAIPHGLAVAWGLDVANSVAMQRGLLSEREHGRVAKLLSRHFSFELPKAIRPGALLDGIRRDKKASSGEVALILMRDFGDVDIFKTTIDEELESQISLAMTNSQLAH